MSDNIEELRQTSFILGVKYAVLWIAQRGGHPDALDMQDHITRDGLMFVNREPTSREIIGNTGGEA
jgi:hypothetical protein